MELLMISSSTCYFTPFYHQSLLAFPLIPLLGPQRRISFFYDVLGLNSFLSINSINFNNSVLSSLVLSCILFRLLYVIAFFKFYVLSFFSSTQFFMSNIFTFLFFNFISIVTSSNFKDIYCVGFRFFICYICDFFYFISLPVCIVFQKPLLSPSQLLFISLSVFPTFLHCRLSFKLRLVLFLNIFYCFPPSSFLLFMYLFQVFFFSLIFSFTSSHLIVNLHKYLRTQKAE